MTSKIGSSQSVNPTSSQKVLITICSAVLKPRVSNIILLTLNTSTGHGRSPELMGFIVPGPGVVVFSPSQFNIWTPSMIPPGNSGVSHGASIVPPGG